MIDIAIERVIIDCGQSDCNLVPWQDPNTYVDLPFWQTGYMLFAIVLVALVFIITVGIVWYRRIEDNRPTRADRKLEARKAELEARARIAESHNTCAACGTRYAPNLEDIKT